MIGYEKWVRLTSGFVDIFWVYSGLRNPEPRMISTVAIIFGCAEHKT